MTGDFVAVINENSPRAADWAIVFGGRGIAIVSPYPEWRSLPGVGMALVVMMDMSRIGPEQYKRLVKHISTRFELPEGDVERDLYWRGCPILFKDVTVVIRNGQVLLDA